MARKQVLMQLNDELVEQLDALGARTGRNRSDLAREAFDALLARYRADDVDQQYVEAYTRVPPTDEFDAEGDEAARAFEAEHPW